MRKEKMDLRHDEMPEEFEAMTIVEQEQANGGSRTDPKQEGWFQKLIDFVTGGSVGGSGVGGGAVVTSS